MSAGHRNLTPPLGNPYCHHTSDALTTPTALSTTVPVLACNDPLVLSFTEELEALVKVLDSTPAVPVADLSPSSLFGALLAVRNDASNPSWQKMRHGLELYFGSDDATDVSRVFRGFGGVELVTSCARKVRLDTKADQRALLRWLTRLNMAVETRR